MLSQWAVEVLKTLTNTLSPKLRLAHPIRFFTDLLFAIAVFFWFNRRPVGSYNVSFFSQLVYLVQLIKAVYTLRFLLVELVFRELRTFFCFISPVVTKLSIVRKWQSADPCVLKVVNLTFFIAFILINFILAYTIEWIGRTLWIYFKETSACKVERFIFKQRRRPKKGRRFRIRGRPRNYCAMNTKSYTRPLLKTLSTAKFWGRKSSTSSDSSLVSGNPLSRERRNLRENLPKGYRVYDKKTRSGKV